MSDQRPAFSYRFATRIHIFNLVGHRLEITAPADPDALLDDPETQKRYAADNSLPYWPIIWPSSLMLAVQILLQSSTDVPRLPCKTLELGCGLGIAGIAAGLMGCDVTFTDYDRESLDFARHNAIANGVKTFQHRLLDWRTPQPEQFDWIIASDVLYERRLHETLLSAIEVMLRPDGVLWITDPQRTAAADFPLLAATRGLRVEASSISWEGESSPAVSGTLLKITRAGVLKPKFA